MSYRSSVSTVHNSLITSTLAEMKRQGMSGIKAAHIAGYAQPEQIGDFIPDATGIHGSGFCVAECESSEGLAQAHTVAQWQTFFTYASRVGGYFIAVVAKADEAAARQLLDRVAGKSNQALIWTF